MLKENEYNLGISLLHTLRKKHFLEENINASYKESPDKKILKGFENDKTNTLMRDPDDYNLMC